MKKQIIKKIKIMLKTFAIWFVRAIRDLFRPTWGLLARCSSEMQIKPPEFINLGRASCKIKKANF